jgi:hypothetical protein
MKSMVRTASAAGWIPDRERGGPQGAKNHASTMADGAVQAKQFTAFRPARDEVAHEAKMMFSWSVTTEFGSGLGAVRTAALAAAAAAPAERTLGSSTLGPMCWMSADALWMALSLLGTLALRGTVQPL